MAVTATPALIRIRNKDAGNVGVVVSTNLSGPIKATLDDASFVAVAPAQIAGSSGTFIITPISYDGGDTVLTISDSVTSINIPIALGAQSQPLSPTVSQFSLGSLMKYIRFLADAPSSPDAATLVMLINQAVIDVSDALNPGFSTLSIPVTPGNSTITLPPDVADFTEVGFSVGDPGIPGTQTYELIELAAGDFMRFNNGFAMDGGLMPDGPTLYFQRVSDVSGRIRLQFLPFPPAGNLNLTYRVRLRLYDPADLNSTSTLDPSYYKLIALLTTQEVCQGTRDFRRAESYQAQYQQMLALKKQTLGRRRTNHGARVRDVMNMQNDGMPTWWP